MSCLRDDSLHSRGMVILFNQRVPLVAALEFALAALVLCGSFINALSGQVSDSISEELWVGSAVAIFAFGQIACLGAFRLYRVHSDVSASVFVLRVILSLVTGGVLIYLTFSAFPGGEGYRDALPEALLVSAAGLVLVRLLLIVGVEMNWLSHRILVLGAGAEAQSVERVLEGVRSPGVTLVGFYPVGNSPSESVSADKIIRSTSSLEESIHALAINEVIVALQEQRGGVLPVSQLLNCRLRGVRITELSAFFERVTGEVPVNSLKASWLIYGEGFRQGWTRRLVKRSFDVAASATLLVLAAPMMLTAALAIFLESGGPVIFRQERVGMGGRNFMLLKFRSMRADAEKDGVPRWAATGDPRVTRVGRFIRRTRIDELPQIFNVLKGEMSFVGPRPERPFFVSQLTEQVPFYGARHSVKPGLTGWAQVRYSYGASVEDAVRKLQYDLYYVKNHSVLLDIFIIFSTFRVVLVGEGVR